MARKYNLPAGVHPDFDRHGNVRYYFRVYKKPKIRLFEKPGTDEFEEEVAHARLGIPYRKNKALDPAAAVLEQKSEEGSLRWLVNEYERRKRPEISADLMARRYTMLIEVCDYRKEGKPQWGALPYDKLRRRHVTEIRDELRDTPGARNNVVKAMSAMFSWAISVGLAEVNPAAGIKLLDSGEGFHTWTEDEVDQFEEHHPLGSTARLALHLALYTGLRLQDLAIIGRQHVKDGWIRIRPQKTAKSSNVTVEIPMLDVLQKTIAASKCGDMAFLATSFGDPFSTKGLGNKFREWCNKAHLPHCTAHGLRKAGATRAAENGATDDQLMAIFGWTTKNQTTKYTKKANRKKMAGKAIHTLLRGTKSA